MQRETSRLFELNSYQILDTPPEKELNEIVELASLTCDCPISLILLLDSEKEYLI
jgi:hypothetical protein